ncbi:MAG TPA: glycosyl hydrolase [Chitinophagaceae bacterium]|nr:glycosyl hydrolase [Chitinophagaceae bacterium]
MKWISTIAAALLLHTTGIAQEQAPQLGKASVKQVVAAMTLEEKAKMVVGMGFRMPGAPAPAKQANAEKPKTDSVSKEGFRLPAIDPADAAIPEKVPGAAGRTHAIPRLGIPSITVSDGPSGVRINPIRNGDSSRTYYATAFPVGTLLASSWDTALVQKVGTAFGAEIRDYGIDIILGPGMNIHRNPLGGRNFEYYSEDPLLTGKMAAAMVRGIQSNGVGTSIKHFAANNQETNRNQINTIVSERTLREIYLKGFEIAVKESSPWTVMSSYNKINGIYTSENPELLTTILRNEWGFKGMVMSDWFGGRKPVEQMKAGNDLLMPGTRPQTDSIIDAVKAGKLDVKLLDRNVEKILHIILLSPSFKNFHASDKPDLNGHAALDRMAAAESMVLLKNENALPVAAKKHIALFGNTSYELIAGGTGSGDVHKAYTVSLKQGLENAGYVLSEKLTGSYENFLKEENAKRPKPRFFFMLPPPVPEMKPGADLLNQAAEESDFAIFTLGRNAGEGQDRKVENDFNLTDVEANQLREVSEAFHKKGKKLIVVLNIGGVIETAGWRDEADAILLAWQPGLEGGNSMADVLSGKQNPSGKLATSFPLQYDDVPSAKYFPGRVLDTTGSANPMRGRPSEVIYEDGIYVGYRYYQSFHVKTAYPFGYGLSYTKFKFSNLTLGSPSFINKMPVSVTVTNTGNVAGKEVVELYLTAPSGKINKPEEELKGFSKTRLLKPGESQTVQMVLDAASLASFNTSLTRWVADAGTYQVKIGVSAEDIRLTKEFTLPKEIQLQKLNKVLVPAAEIDEMKP